MIFTIMKRMITVSVAFIIFGIMDNGIMIIAGDVIDSHISATLGTSVLFAAGLGNTISDAVGMISGRFVEKILHKNFTMAPAEGLSLWTTVTAETIGIVLGCLIGLTPLLLL